MNRVDKLTGRFNTVIKEENTDNNKRIKQIKNKQKQNIDISLVSDQNNLDNKINKKFKIRMCAYVSSEIQEQVRNAWWWTRNEDGGSDSISEWVEDALHIKLKEMYNQYNNGLPFKKRRNKRIPHSH